MNFLFRRNETKNNKNLLPPLVHHDDGPLAAVLPSDAVPAARWRRVAPVASRRPVPVGTGRHHHSRARLARSLELGHVLAKHVPGAEGRNEVVKFARLVAGGVGAVVAVSGRAGTAARGLGLEAEIFRHRTQQPLLGFALDGALLELEWEGEKVVNRHAYSLEFCRNL